MNRLRMKEEGFTLIELLVVIAIIGILAAIAIPQFAAYRKRSFAADVKSNLHNAAAAEEAYFVTANVYLANALSSGTPEGFNLSTNVLVSSAITPNSFTLTASHANCGTDAWTYTSVGGTIAYTPGDIKCDGPTGY
jgi:type IV pilus assembly protein PilA